MKSTLLTVLFLVTTTLSFAQKARFGAKVKEKNSITTESLLTKMATADTLNTKVSGVVESVCQVKGCWMKVKLPEGKTMRVTFKNYGFFVPKDLAGKTVVFEGKAFTKTTSVKDLQHYAEDAGKSKEEIAKITQPEKALSFVADGVLLQQ